MKLIRNQFAICLFCLLISAVAVAQVKTQTTTTPGAPTVQTTVERGEVVSVSGNDLVVKMENGQIRNFLDVPETARVSVGGQQLSVHDLKPGMKLERTITTTNTPQLVSTVQTVKGKVWQVSPPSSVILTLEDGTNQRFKIPKGQKFTVNGQETDAFGLKKGMEVSATKIVTVPENVATRQQRVTGEMPPAPSTDALQGGPVLIVVQTKQPAQVAQANPPETQTQAKKLPQTASALPLIGLVGMVLLVSGVVFSFLTWRRAH